LADGRSSTLTIKKPNFPIEVGLNQLTFQRGLGSYADKIERMLELTTLLTRSSKLEAKYCVPMERAVELCKLDLVTNLVRELPELQGYVGAWYAEQEQQPPEVVHAIASHYAPRSADDAIPADVVGQLISVVDKSRQSDRAVCPGQPPKRLKRPLFFAPPSPGSDRRSCRWTAAPLSQFD